MGAEDCFLVTIISGLICGTPFYEYDPNVGLGGLVTLTSSLEATCKDITDFTLSREHLREEIIKLGIDFSEKIKKLFFNTD